MKKLLIKNAQDVDNNVIHILIEGEHIKSVSSQIPSIECNTIDAKGLHCLPGLIDMQVHLREPGQEEKETLQTGTLAAAKGGFTTVACMPNTNPTLDNETVIQQILIKAQDLNNCRILPIPAISKGIKGEELCDFALYKQLGLLGVTDDGRGIQSPKLMQAAFEKAKKHKLTIFQHCEVEAISLGHPMHLGSTSESLGVMGQPAEAESEMIRRDLELLKASGGHYHILHLSCQKSLELVRKAKEDGLNVTCEVTPHHLILCDEDIKEADPNFKMNPPLRSRADRQALQEALLDGTIDFITTDHAPHTEAEKSLDFAKAPFGIIGLEISFALIYTHFVQNQRIGLKRVVELMSLNPKKIFDLENGDLKVGSFADLVLVDLNKDVSIDHKCFLSKGRNTPFVGATLKGMPILTLFKGRTTYQNENYEFKR